MYSFSYLEPVCCSMSSSNCCFLTCIEVSQEAGQVVWYSHLFQNFPQFIVIHIVKDFGIVNKAEIDVFLELSCFFDIQRVLAIWSQSSVLSSSTTSLGVVIGSASMMALNFVVNFWWPAAALLIFKLSAPLQNFLSHYCTVCSLAVSGSNALMLWVVSAALRPILNSNKKNHPNLLFV